MATPDKVTLFSLKGFYELVGQLTNVHGQVISTTNVRVEIPIDIGEAQEGNGAIEGGVKNPPTEETALQATNEKRGRSNGEILLGSSFFVERTIYPPT